MPVDRAGSGGGGLTEYTTQLTEHGAISPILSRLVCGGGDVP